MLCLTIPALDDLSFTTCSDVHISAPKSCRLFIRRFRVSVPLNASDIDTGTEDSTLHKTGDDKPKKPEPKTPGAMPFDLLTLISKDAKDAAIKNRVVKTKNKNDPIKQFIQQTQLSEQEIDSIGVADDVNLELKALEAEDISLDAANTADRDIIEDHQEEEDLKDHSTSSSSTEPTIVADAGEIDTTISDPLDTSSVMEMLIGTGVSIDGNGLVNDATNEHIGIDRIVEVFQTTCLSRFWCHCIATHSF